MNPLTHLGKAIKAIEEWQQEIDDEIAEGVEEAFQRDLERQRTEVKKPVKPRKPRPDPVDMLLDPAYRNYMRDNRHKLPVDGKTE
jgi:septal ring factor EnvC (AmiA/AmiB activator)